MSKKRSYIRKVEVMPTKTKPDWLRLSEKEKEIVNELALRYHKTKASMLRYLVLKGIEAINGQSNQ